MYDNRQAITLLGFGKAIPFGQPFGGLGKLAEPVERFQNMLQGDADAQSGAASTDCVSDVLEFLAEPVMQSAGAGQDLIQRQQRQHIIPTRIDTMASVVPHQVGYGGRKPG